MPLANLAPKDLQEFKDAFRLSQEFTKRWVDLGGKIIGGTDDPSVGTCGLSVHMEMAMLVEAGLTPMQALQSMSLWGAEMLTARKKTPTKPPVGLIGEGANADLVILSANPLTNIENTKKIERVMKGGRFMELGYTPHYTGQVTVGGAIPSTPAPELSAITPNTVAEGTAAFEITVEGVGFISNSIVRIDDMAVPDLRTPPKRACPPTSSPRPHRFNYPGARTTFIGIRALTPSSSRQRRRPRHARRLQLRLAPKQYSPDLAVDQAPRQDDVFNGSRGLATMLEQRFLRVFAQNDK